MSTKLTTLLHEASQAQYNVRINHITGDNTTKFDIVHTTVHHLGVFSWRVKTMSKAGKVNPKYSAVVDVDEPVMHLEQFPTREEAIRAAVRAYEE